MSRVFCDSKIAARVKGEIYKMVMRPDVVYGLEMVLTKRHEAELEVKVLKILRFSSGVSKLSEGQLRLNDLETNVDLDAHSFTAEIKMFVACHNNYLHCFPSLKTIPD